MTDVALYHPTTPLDWLRIYLLYRRAFPREERKPFSMIRKMCREGRTIVWLARITDGRFERFAGMASTIEGEGTTLLDYFAVSKHLRGQGYGSAFMQRLLLCYEDRGLFVEIEAADREDPTGEKARRKQFYLRNGMAEMGVTVILFGVRMELLGRGCCLDFDGYRDFYRTYYNAWAAEHIVPPLDN